MCVVDIIRLLWLFLQVRELVSHINTSNDFTVEQVPYFILICECSNHFLMTYYFQFSNTQFLAFLKHIDSNSK